MCGASDVKKLVVAGTLVAIDFDHGDKAVLDVSQPGRPVVVHTESKNWNYPWGADKTDRASLSADGTALHVDGKFGGGYVNVRAWPELAAVLKTPTVAPTQAGRIIDALALLAA